MAVSENKVQFRTSRARESKLKITEAEKRYKERAVKGIVFDTAEMIEREAEKGDGRL